MKVLVVCFYQKGNLGDNFFVEAYRQLFPEYDLTFTDRITSDMVSEYEVFFFGGGSFLDGQPPIDRDLLEKLGNKKLFYLGVGAETQFHTWHKFLLQKARLIAVRNQKSVDRVSVLNSRVILVPDLVYSLVDEVRLEERKEKSILFIPNAHTVSKWDSATWKHSAWEFFKSEMAQALDGLVEAGWGIDILPMCGNNYHQDSFAGGEIIGKMHSSVVRVFPFEDSYFQQFAAFVSRYSIVISQRYHGLVVADMTGTPSVNIHHHDKLRHFLSKKNIPIDFYGCSKGSITDAIHSAEKLSNSERAINTNAFIELRSTVKEGMKG